MFLKGKTFLLKLMVTSGTVKFFAVKKTCFSISFIHTTLCYLEFLLLAKFNNVT
jgi:hypothetical protein